MAADIAIIPNKIIVYGVTWCGDCRRAKRVLDQAGADYEWINIDQDCDAEQFVLKHNRGMRSVPTIVFPDGSILVEPGTRELEVKLATVAV